MHTVIEKDNKLELVEIKTTTDDKGKMYDEQGKFIPAFVTTYKPIAGYKAVLLSWEDFDEEAGQYTPWNTGYFGHANVEDAKHEAKGWALSEDIPYQD